MNKYQKQLRRIQQKRLSRLVTISDGKGWNFFGNNSSIQEQIKIINENSCDDIEALRAIGRSIKPIVSTEEISALEEQGVNCNIRLIVL